MKRCQNPVSMDIIQNTKGQSTKQYSKALKESCDARYIFLKLSYSVVRHILYKLEWPGMAEPAFRAILDADT